MINGGCSWVGHPETAADQAHHVQAVSSRPADTKALSWPGKSLNVLEPVAGRDLNPVRDVPDREGSGELIVLLTTILDPADARADELVGV